MKESTSIAFKSSFCDAVVETVRFINAHLKVAFEIIGVTTQRTEIVEYPAR